ncbi:hypothetical protein FNL53_03725 [Tardiphaga sp. vice278]|nr:hypothetical protein FNL53_03725 [Tardiphaga sp. vice278]
MQLHIANEGIKIFTRRGHDWTDRFKKIATDAWHLKVKSAVIDGEVVVPAADGTTDFAVLQKVLRAGNPPLTGGHYNNPAPACPLNSSESRTYPRRVSIDLCRD